MIHSKTSDLQTEDKVEVNFRQPFVNIDNNQNNFLLQKENVSFFVQKSRDFVFNFRVIYTEGLQTKFCRRKITQT